MITACICKLFKHPLTNVSPICVLSQLPQLLKMIGAKSGEGISFSSVILELAAISTTVAYSVAKSFPFRLFNDSCFHSVLLSLYDYSIILICINLSFPFQCMGRRTFPSHANSLCGISDAFVWELCVAGVELRGRLYGNDGRSCRRFCPSSCHNYPSSPQHTHNDCFQSKFSRCKKILKLDNYKQKILFMMKYFSSLWPEIFWSESELWP